MFSGVAGQRTTPLVGAALKILRSHIAGYDTSNKFTPLVLHRHCHTSLLNNPIDKAPTRKFPVVVQNARKHLNETLASPRATRSATAKSQGPRCTCTLCETAYPCQSPGRQLFSPIKNPQMKLKRRRSSSSDERRKPISFTTPADKRGRRRLSGSTTPKRPGSCPPPLSSKRPKHEMFAISIKDWLEVQQNLILPTRKSIKLQSILRKLLDPIVKESSVDRLFEPGFKDACARLKRVFSDLYEAVDFMEVSGFRVFIHAFRCFWSSKRSQ